MRIAYLIIFCLFLASCLPSGVFEKNQSFLHHRWHKKDKASFSFSVTDTQSNYQLFLYLRHTANYPYSNIWLNIHTQLPGVKDKITNRVEIPLANAEGKWLAKGMNDILEHKKWLHKNLHFTKPGNYVIELEQIMRDDPLPEVMSAGVILEKNINN